MRRLEYALKWMVCALALSLVACASAGNAMRQAVADTAVTVAAGYRSLGVVDKVAQDRIRVVAKTDPATADEQLTAHLKRYDVARKALDAAAAAVVSANAAIPLVDKGVAKEKSPAAWIADLVALGLTVMQSLQQLGVKL